MIATLIATLVEEDHAEDDGVLAPDDRLTCHVHGRWIHQCVASPVHVNPVTRHRHRRATGLLVQSLRRRARRGGRRALR
jgi:hypothetical protein